MTTEELIASIAVEKTKSETHKHSEEGLLRLQEVAAAYTGDDELVWSDELLAEIKARPAIPVHKTKLPLLDALIGGLREQQLISIGAHTKHGKTTFGCFLMEQFEDLSPVMIPLEQSNEEILEQRDENGYSIPKFLSPRRNATDPTVDWIEQRIIEGIAKHNTKLVLIDHLGYINNLGPKGKNRNENLAYRIGEVARGLKNIAKRWNVIIVLLVHISQSDESKPPTLQDIKNSSDVSQESDLVLMLWRKSTGSKKIRVYENKTLVSVLANRRTGKNGNVGLMFNTTTGRYYEDNAWVRDMEAAAQRQIDVDDEFNSI